MPPPGGSPDSDTDADASTRGTEIAEGRTDFRDDDDDDEATATTANALMSQRDGTARAQLERAAANARGLAVANIARAVPIKS